MINKPYRILIVDDEANMLKQLTILLKNHNFEVETANDGEEGLKKLLTNEFSVALVDLRMPKMDGLTMIQKADEQDIDTFVIILTGKGDKDDAVKAIKLQNTVKDWFDKSGIDSKKLVERITRLAEGMPFEEIDRMLKNVTLEA